MQVELSATDKIAIALCFISTLIGALVAWLVTKYAISRTRRDIESAVAEAVATLQKTIPKDAAGEVTKDSLLRAILATAPLIVKVAAHLSDKSVATNKMGNDGGKPIPSDGSR